MAVVCLRGVFLLLWVGCLRWRTADFCGVAGVFLSCFFLTTLFGVLGDGRVLFLFRLLAHVRFLLPMRCRERGWVSGWAASAGP